MSNKCVVVRMYGDQSMGRAIQLGMESAELTRLRRRIELSDAVQPSKNRRKIAGIKRRYPIRQANPVWDKIITCIALLYIAFADGGNYNGRDKECQYVPDRKRMGSSRRVRQGDGVQGVYRQGKCRMV